MCKEIPKKMFAKIYMHDCADFDCACLIGQRLCLHVMLNSFLFAWNFYLIF